MAPPITPSVRDAGAGWRRAVGPASAPRRSASWRCRCVRTAPGCQQGPRRPARATSQTVGVQTAEDSADEEDGTFTLELSNPSGATLGDAAATGTIEDDDESLPR